MSAVDRLMARVEDALRRQNLLTLASTRAEDPGMRDCWRIQAARMGGRLEELRRLLAEAADAGEARRGR